jgi:hypothetical protein
MTSDRAPDSAGTRRDTENLKVNDLPMADAAAEKVKGGLGPVDGKTNPKPFGPAVLGFDIEQ